MWEGGRDDKYRKEIREGRSENEQKALCTGIELSTSKFNRQEGLRTETYMNVDFVLLIMNHKKLSNCVLSKFRLRQKALTEY